MNSNFSISALTSIVLLAGCGTVTHTPPGTSVEVALAKKGELVAMPAPTPGPATAAARVPAVEPTLPNKTDVTEKVAEAYSRGIFLMEAQSDTEALAAFTEVVKLDPTFTDAWEKMAIIYEKGGDSKKAMEAFNKAKTLARQ